MVPTADQERALLEIERGITTRMARPVITVIGGYAGTGKTSLLNMVWERFGEGIVLTPTGKAALRVKDATGIEAKTAHRWLYRPKQDERTGELKFIKQEKAAEPKNRAIFFDEASMMGPELFDDIYAMATKLGVNIVAIGDSFQLPPVQKKPGAKPFSVLDPTFPADYRAQLNEVVRQAAENPIIKASMEVRNGRALEVLYDQTFKWVKGADIVTTAIEVLNRGGVILCHTNATRNLLNNQIRERLGHKPGVLSQDEPLLVINNNYALDTYNGEVIPFYGWERGPQAPVELLDKWSKEKSKVTYGKAAIRTASGMRTCSISLEEVFGKLDMSKINVSTLSGGSKDWFDRGLQYLHANLGYALTCHKAQGSEWPEVLLVLEQTINLGSHMGRRFFYTAITRARENVIIGSIN